jgi:integrase
MDRTGLSTTNALTRVTKVETRGREKVRRRSFTLEELERLIAVSGVRRIGYLAPFYTGLRRAELEQLEWGDVHLEAGEPFIEARASITKNHERSEIPLHPVLETELRAIKPENIEAGAPVFSREMIASMDRMKADLRRAGILYFDTQGRRADFHALRRSCNTHMALGKIDPDTRKKLMRHSDVRLTMETYTDSQMLPLAAAIRSLPALGQDATLCATNSDIFGHLVSRCGTNEKYKPATESAADEGISHVLAPSGTNGLKPGKTAPCRNRTYAKIQ